MTKTKKRLTAKKAEELLDSEIETLIHLAMVERRYLEEKYLNACKRMAFFCKDSPTLMPVVANEAYLILKHAAKLGVVPSYFTKRTRKSSGSSTHKEGS